MSLSATPRIESIDLVRGGVVVLMALDHVRDYFHAANFLFEPNDLAHTSAAIFFTRWITHFCAPAFVFLAGTSAFLLGERTSQGQLTTFLLTRGLWLLVVEVTVVSFAWSFNPSFTFTKLQVIWALGLCMVILSGLIYLPKPVILLLGLVIVFGHNLLDNVHFTDSRLHDFLWSEVHEKKRFLIRGHTIAVVYPILAWVGVMALGYWCGQYYRRGVEALKRRRFLLATGAVAVLLFFVLRTAGVYGDPEAWAPQRSAVLTVCSFFNVTKYPPSLLYLLITLGGILIALALVEGKTGWLGRRLLHYGRVPLFFYVAHIVLLHLVAALAIRLSGRPWSDTILKFNSNAKDSPWLAGYGFSLPTTYLIWVAIILTLYPLCKWYDTYKLRHREQWWLSYL